MLFNYLDVDFGNVAWAYGASATIGIQGPDPTPAAKQFLAYAFDRVKAVRENCPILFNRIASIRLQMHAKQDTDGITGNECGITDNLMVAPGSTVEICFTITNTGAVELGRHDLTSNAFGVLLQNFPHSLVPGASAFLTQKTVINGPTTFTGPDNGRPTIPARWIWSPPAVRRSSMSPDRWADRSSTTVSRARPRC